MIKASFILLTIIMAALVYAGVHAVSSKAIADEPKRGRFRLYVIVLIAGWLAYVSALSLTGILATKALPPRIPLMLILPCFLFIAWFFRGGRFRDVINATPPGWLVYSQSFRIVVELLLLGLYLEGILPKAGTFEGYNYEIITGITAIAVGYFGTTRKVLPRALLLLWNYMGLATLAIVVFIMVSHVYFPSIYSNPEPLLIADFGAFPYTLLAGFLMPLAVFLHVFSIVKTSSVHSITK